MNTTNNRHKSLLNLANTPEQKEKRRKTYRERRNAKWKSYFDAVGGQGTCEDIAKVSKTSVGSISASISRMRKEVPAVIGVVGHVERKFSNGNKKLIYMWIGG